jgi:hypothetical protein
VNAEALARGLAALGIRGAIETRGGMAVLTVRDLRPLEDPAVRSAALALAAEHGFTTLALELHDGDDRAPLPRD